MPRGCVWLWALALSSAASVWAAADDAVELSPLSTTLPANTLALSDDASVLLVAHESANKVSFWDVRSGKHLGLTTCPSPRFILCRGNLAYVANYGKGTISVLSIVERRLTDELSAGDKNVYFLSAPDTAHFDGRLLATCGDKDYRNVQLVTIKTDTHRKLRTGVNLAPCAAVVDSRGRHVIEVGHPGGWPNDTLGVYRYEEYIVDGGKNRISKGYLPGFNFTLQQVPGTAMWTSGNGIKAAMPPAPLWQGFGGATIFADAKAPAIYSYGHAKDQLIEAFGAEITLPSLGQRAIRFGGPAQPGMDMGGIPQDGSCSCSPPVAVSLGSRLILYGISQGHIMRGEMPAFVQATSQHATTLPRQDTVPVAASRPRDLPPTVIAGKLLTLRLAGPPGSRWSLKKGPVGATVTTDGILKWTPGPDQLGFHEFKIVALHGDDITTLSWQPQVVLEETGKLMGTASIVPAKLGRHPIVDAPFHMTAGTDGSVLLLQADYLRILDRHGLTVQRQHLLDEVYLRIYERQEYYVALGVSFVDLLRKDTLKPIRRISLPWPAPWDMVLQPQSKVTYVAAEAPAADGGPKGRKLVMLTVNEETGQIARDEKCAGRVIRMDPKGRYVFAQHLTQDEGYPNLPWLGRAPRGAGFARYSCSAGLAKDQEYKDLNTELVGFSFSADGQYIGLFHNEARFGSKNPAAMIFTPAEMGTPKRLLEIPRRGSTEDMLMASLDFHPSLPIVAVGTWTHPWLFDLASGQPLQDRIDLTGFSRPSAITQVMFSPGGEHLLVAYKGQYVQAFAMKLTEAEQAIVAKGRDASSHPVGSQPSSTTQPAWGP